MPALTLVQLPKEYKNRFVKQRLPFALSGDLVVPAATSGRTYPDGTFYYAQDLPFEVVSMHPNVTTLDNNGVPQADPNIGSTLRSVQIVVQLIGSVRTLTPAACRLSVLVGSVEWEFDQPLYLERGSGFQVTVNNQIPSGSAAGGIRMEIAFKGSLLDIGG